MTRVHQVKGRDLVDALELSKEVGARFLRIEVGEHGVDEVVHSGHRGPGRICRRDDQLSDHLDPTQESPVERPGPKRPGLRRLTAGE